METLHALPQIKNYLFSLYECRYADFFKSLAYVEQYMKSDRYFNRHYSFYVREMRIVAYNQLLESYSSLALSYMAEAFGVSPKFIDKYENKTLVFRFFFYLILGFYING